jgi:hypothetical protein
VKMDTRKGEGEEKEKKREEDKGEGGRVHDGCNAGRNLGDCG